MKGYSLFTLLWVGIVSLTASAANETSSDCTPSANQLPTSMSCTVPTRDLASPETDPEKPKPKKKKPIDRKPAQNHQK